MEACPCRGLLEVQRGGLPLLWSAVIFRGLLEVQGGRGGGLHQGVGLLKAQDGGLPLPCSAVVYCGLPEVQGGRGGGLHQGVGLLNVQGGGLPCRGLTWSAMVCSRSRAEGCSCHGLLGLPWSAQGPGWWPALAAVSRGLLWSAMVCRGLPWSRVEEEEGGGNPCFFCC